MTPLPVPNIFRFGQRDRSRRAAVEDYDEPAEHTQSLTGNAVEIMSPSSSCYSDEAPTPVIGPGVGHSQLYETFSTSTESSCEACEEPLPIRAPEHYGDHMHAPLDEEAHREFANAPRAMPVEIVNSTSSSEARRRVTFVPFDDSSDMSDRQTNTSSSSSIPRSVRGILKSPRQAFAQRLYEERVPQVIRAGGDSDYGSTSSSVSTSRAMGKLLNKENIRPRDYTRKPPTPPQDMYFVIPGNSPVIFQDENGKEIYRVEAVKTSRRHRRKKYIFQDEDGNELCRVGDFGEEGSSYTGSVTGSSSSSVSTSSSRSVSAKMVYLGSDGSVTTEDSSSTLSDASSSSSRRSDDGYVRDASDRYGRDDYRRDDSYRRDGNYADAYRRDDGYRRDDSRRRGDGYRREDIFRKEDRYRDDNYRRDDDYRRRSPQLNIVDEEGRLMDERGLARRGRSHGRDDFYPNDGYDERDYV